MAIPKKATSRAKPANSLLGGMPREILPMTANQKAVFYAFQDDNKHLVLRGAAGTGKSFISLYLALVHLYTDPSIEKLIIIRSARPSVDMGFLPGTMAEKLTLFEAPYFDIVGNLLEDDTAYKKMRDKGIIDFMSTSYMRGLTFSNAVVILDEAQNCSSAELHTVATRIGDNCRLIVIGDDAQQDYMRHEASGFWGFSRVLDRMASVKLISFGPEDVVRSGFAKEYLLKLIE